MKKTIRWLAGVLIVCSSIVWIAWITSPDPRVNPASFEDAPVEPEIARLSEAITLASFATENGIATMIVTRLEGEDVYGVNLTALGADRTGNPLRDLASVDPTAISADGLSTLPESSRKMSELLPAAPRGDRHIGTGTNFPEHAEEANSDAVFRFPKFGTATPARTTVVAPQGVLLDYEVELCMRFDRDISSKEDFDLALKGVFLCGDFTNRNALVELADPDDLDSGFGFSDAKSGPDFYPSGALLVVPVNWADFVDRVRMTTSVNGERRQDARGGEMTMDFRELATASLADMGSPRFFYDGEFYKLAENSEISEEMTLMSGTSEGVIFTPPARADYIEGVRDYLVAGGPLSGKGLVDTVKARFIANELRSAHFLQPGDIVRHRSNYLGDIAVEVVAP